MLICEDMWHPTAVALLARQGVELLVCPSASPGRGVVQGHALGTARSYDAMTSDRPYRPAMSPQQAALILKGGRNRPWEGAIVDAFQNADTPTQSPAPQFNEVAAKDGRQLVGVNGLVAGFDAFLVGGQAAPAETPWRTGDRVREDEDSYLYFEGRTDDVIISAGYRIGPFEVESALVSHPAVAEAAVVAAPDDERGAVVRAVVVLRDGYDPSQALETELQNHVKHETAPYKYPRIVDFAAELPKTASGKVQHALLRAR